MRDADVRKVLLAHLTAGGHHVIEELGLQRGRNRVDVAVVSSGRLVGFEIKSDKDTLLRLAKQQKAYGRVFDRMAIVSGSKHLEKAIAAVPAWWGVIEARLTDDGTVTLHPIRNGSDNPKIDTYTLAMLLWRDEIYEELKVRGLARGHSKSNRRTLALTLAAGVQLDELRLIVQQRMLSRKSWRTPAPRRHDRSRRKPPHKERRG